MTAPLPAGARIAAACAIGYTCGYVTGPLLVGSRHDRATLDLGIVRTVAGLILTSVAFLLSLKLSIPWFTGPTALFVLAAIVHRGSAFAPPRPRHGVEWQGVIAGLVMLAPIVVSAVRTAPGPFPSVFFNLDLPYLLEGVHALRYEAYPFSPERMELQHLLKAEHWTPAIEQAARAHG